nr:root allergen protein-like [Tanacetum cinerariifolium]
MSTATIQIEIPLVHPAEKVFKAISDFDTIAPKFHPEVFKSIKIIEGNGDVGTIREFTFGDGVPFSITAKVTISHLRRFLTLKKVTTKRPSKLWRLMLLLIQNSIDFCFPL